MMAEAVVVVKMVLEGMEMKGMVEMAAVEVKAEAEEVKGRVEKEVAEATVVIEVMEAAGKNMVERTGGKTLRS